MDIVYVDIKTWENCVVKFGCNFVLTIRQYFYLLVGKGKAVLRVDGVHRYISQLEGPFY